MITAPVSGSINTMIDGISIKTKAYIKYSILENLKKAGLDLKILEYFNNRKEGKK